MARGLVLTLAFLLAAGASLAQAPGKNTNVDGALVPNARPFPMVLDAGTDTFTPQDYDTVMASAALAAKNKKALLMYSTYDEFGPRGWGCFCARCVRKYRDYLKAQYTELAALNRAWSANYN